MSSSHHIADLLTRVLEHEQQWKYQLLRNWQTIFGKLSDKVHLEKIQRDTLIVAVDDACWLQELYALSDILLAAINEKLDKPYVKRLRFKQGGKRKRRETASAKKQSCPPQQVVTLSKKEEAALSHIQDPVLAAALRDFLVRCYQERGDHEANRQYHNHAHKHILPMR